MKLPVLGFSISFKQKTIQPAGTGWLCLLRHREETLPYPFFSTFFTFAFTSGERTFPAARTGRGGRAQNRRTT